MHSQVDWTDFLVSIKQFVNWYKLEQTSYIHGGDPCHLILCFLWPMHTNLVNNQCKQAGNIIEVSEEINEIKQNKEMKPKKDR